MILIPLSVEKCVFSCRFSATALHLTSCTPTKSNLHFNSFLKTVIRGHTLYKLLTFHNSNLIRIPSLGLFIQRNVQVRGSVIFLRWRVINPMSKPPSWGTTPCRLSTAAYSIYSQLLSIAGSRQYGKGLAVHRTLYFTTLSWKKMNWIPALN
jgi:hypothetical protein